MRVSLSLPPALTLVGTLLALSCMNPVSHPADRGPISAAAHNAAVVHRVPEDLLLAVAWAGSRFQPADPHSKDNDNDADNSADISDGAAAEDGHHGQSGGFAGIVENDVVDRGLLERAAADAGVDVDQANSDPVQSVKLAAALLRLLAGDDGDQDLLSSWRPALLAMAGGDEHIGALFVDEVFAVLDAGVSGAAASGELLVIAPHDPARAQARRAGIAQGLTADSALVAQVLPARDGHWHRGRSQRVDRIIIHTTEGSYWSAINWFRSASNPYQTSAHYVIRSSDGEITQMVDEGDTAYHIGDYNPRAIGIEHEAISANPAWFTDAMLTRSARLTADIARRNNIPVDRAHIVGHVEVPGASHTDPGPHFPWDRYMNLVRQFRTGNDVNRCSNFPETGQRVCGRLLAYFEAGGGLSTFGFPLTAEGPRAELGGRVAQVFQRFRLEKHPENRAPWDVQLGLLGANAYGAAGGFVNGFDVAAPGNDCRFVGPSHQQGQWVCGAILDWFDHHGVDLGEDGTPSWNERVALCGWPISAEQSWRARDDTTWQVQHFQRCRLERHEENRGTDWYILGGLLGAESIGR